MEYTYDIEIHGKAQGKIDSLKENEDSVEYDIEKYVKSTLSELFESGLSNLSFSISNIKTAQEKIDPYAKVSEYIGLDINNKDVFYIVEQHSSIIYQCTITDICLWSNIGSSDITVYDVVRNTDVYFQLNEIQIFDSLEKAKEAIVKEIIASQTESTYMTPTELLERIAKQING